MRIIEKGYKVQAIIKLSDEKGEKDGGKRGVQRERREDVKKQNGSN